MDASHHEEILGPGYATAEMMEQTFAGAGTLGIQWGARQ